ncbi:hypothetical protein ACOSQ4_018384 [Xanthoceras sorbifolium]
MLKAGTISLSASLLSPNQTHFSLAGPLFTFTSKNALFLSSSQQIQQTNLSLPRRDNGMLSSLCALTLNNKSRKNDTALRETDGSDFDDVDDEEQEEEQDDDDKEGMFLPFEEMKRWLENKPRGFGEVVSGNKKTKDPICKGFAFVDFKSEEDATRFTQIFSKQSISFGKIQKQIKCEMMNSTSSKFVDEHSAHSAYNNVELTAPGLEEEPDADSNVDYDTSDSWMEAASDGSDPYGELDLAKMEDIRENLEIVSVLELNGRDNKKQDKKSSRDSSSSNQRKKIQVIKKKQIAKGDVKKVPKLDIPGSAKRLKVKEKAVLTDVFSKYAVKAALTSKEES